MHLGLEPSVDTGAALFHKAPLSNEASQTVRIGSIIHSVSQPGGHGISSRVTPGLQNQVAVGGRGQLVAEESGHGRLEGRAEQQLVYAEEAPRGGRKAVVVGKGEHEAAGKGVAVDQGHGGHGVREQAAPQRVEQRPEARGGDGVGEVEAVAEELGDATGGDDDARCVGAELDGVEGREDGLAHGRGEAVVGRRGERKEVDGW